MPPYKSNKEVAENIDDIYAYFKALAEGKIESGEEPKEGKVSLSE
ncbi:MAG: hypothetical protein ACREV9_12515 [Burkholderiales bacterium]